MWRGLGQDPGGSSGLDPPNNPELDDLKDQFEQQQLLIAQLKEMLRKNEQVNVTQEKVEAYANTLTKMKARAKKHKKEGKDTQSTGKKLETPATEKMDKLRQEMEENKMKLAERDKSQKGIEEMVTQLKAQFDASQTLISQTPLNLSFIEVDVKDYSPQMTSNELYNILTSKEKKMSEMVAKIQKLEANVLDLQENIKEKDSVIDARTKAITLMSENLSKKGKSTLDALDETKMQMRKMQENFVEMEQQMNEEIQQLKQEVTDKDIEVSHLNDRNNYLEHIRKELTVSNTEIQEKLDRQLDLMETFQKGDSVVEKLQETIKELEEENKRLQHQEDTTDNTQNLELNSKIAELENVISEKENQNQLIQNELASLQEKLKPKSVYDMDFKSDDNDELSRLKKQLDESNKNMIKVKAQHKAKLKEMTKKIDGFKKMGDLNVEIVKLQDENSKLSQKVAELEEEKGALQLKMLETSGGKDTLALEAANELERQLTELSDILTYKDNQILTLSQSLDESAAKLKELDKKVENLSHLENVQVKSEITSIQLEEQLDKLEVEKSLLSEEKYKLEEENKKLQENIDLITKEKQEVSAKLDTYIQENMELVDKLEKLSAEKVSSAESIEIVEGLTQQEKLELEAYQKNTNIPSDTKSSAEHLAENLELNESVNQLTEETSELLQRIELFSVERREVMEKMEQLANDNNQLNIRIKEIENNRDVLAETYELLQTEKEVLDTTLQDVQKQKLDLENSMIELKSENELLRKNLQDKMQIVEEEQTKQTDTSSQYKSTKKGKKRNQKSALQTSESEQKIQDNKEDVDLKIRNNELSKEIEEYKLLIGIQKQEIQELKVQIMGQDFIRSEKLDVEAKLSSLEVEYKTMLQENEDLRKQVKEYSEKVQEKDDVEHKLRDARKEIEVFEKKVSENLEEIENYKSIFEENKSELISSSNQIKELHNRLNVKEDELKSYTEEIQHLNSVISDLNSAVKQLEMENEKTVLFDDMSKEVGELKEILRSNIDQIDEYEEELNKNTTLVNELQNEIHLLNNRIRETEHLLEGKNNEINTLRKENEDKQSEILELTEEIKLKNVNFHQTVEELRSKCFVLQNQISTNTDSMEPLENKIKELEERNKEQLEKMKKIAANLKKKTNQYQELEQKYMEMHEKWESEIREKDNMKYQEVENENIILKNQILEKDRLKSNLENTIEGLEKDLFDLQEKINAKNSEYNKLHIEFNLLKQNADDRSNEFSKQLSHYENQIENLNLLVKDYEEKLSQVPTEVNSAEIAKKDTLIQKLTQKAKSFKQQLQTLLKENENLKLSVENQKSDFQIQANASQMKIQELELFIETQDSELNKYKEKVNKLEDGLHSVEERRMSLERKAIELGTELEEKTYRYEELSYSEDILEKRIESLIKHDEIIEKRLQDAIGENELLNKMHKELLSENDELHSLVKHLQERFNEISNNNENITVLENENGQLKQIVANLENDKKHLRNDYEQKISKMREDTEKNELELQNQVEFYNNDHKVLTEKCEMLSDRIKELQDYQNMLSNDIESYKSKLMEQDQCIDENQQKFDILQSEFNNKLDIIEKLTEHNHLQEENIKQLQSTISTQETEAKEENSNLRCIIEERTKQLELYQQENSQLLIQSINQSALSADHIESLKQEKDRLTLQLVELTNSYDILSRSHQELLTKLNNLERRDSIDKTEKKDIDDTIGTFTWPSSNSDNDLFLSQNVEVLGATPANNSHNQNDELLSKIKSLEFMLFTSEKEKEDTLKQCETLSSELAKLLYLQESEKHGNLNLDSQIINVEDTAMSSKDISELQSIEFEPVKEICDQEQHTPVVEEEIHPKTAYLCYPENPIVDTFGENDDGWGWSPEEVKLEQEHIQNRETLPHSEQFRSQIGALEEKIRILEQARERHSEEIKQSQQKSGKLIKKLKEFKLKNDELAAQLNKKSDGFDDLNIAIEDELKSQINNLEKRIKDINAELEKERNEKSNLTKKVDTLMAANDRLVESKEKQEIEIISWQNRTRELNAKLEQFEWGDGGFETPVHMPKKTSESEPLPADIENLKVQINELTETIKDLTLDNEELQALLEEQRNLRISAEKAKSVEPISDNMKTEAEYLAVVTEKIALNEELEALKTELQSFKEGLHSLEQEKESLHRIYNELQEKYNNVFVENADHQQNLLKSNETIQELQKEVASLQQETMNLNESKKDSNDKFNQLLQENNSYHEEFDKYQLIITNLESKLTTTQKEYDNYKLKNIQSNENQLLDLQQNIQKLSEENSDLNFKLNNQEELLHQNTQQAHEKDKEIKILNDQSESLIEKLSDMQNRLVESAEVIKVKETELTSLREKLHQQQIEHEDKLLLVSQQLAEEWMQKVDQRGYDIAESWKLHLEERENEFYQIEQMLRKEIAELEEKHNILVNENNELRKNVDAEIRNEVDRISALQAQINEKQYYVNELSAELEKQKEEISAYRVSVNELNLLLSEKDEKLSQFETIKAESEKLKSEFENKEKAYQELQVSLTDSNRILKEKDLIIQEKERILIENNTLLADKENLVKSLSEQQQYATSLEMQNLVEKNSNYEREIQEIRHQLNEKENSILQLNDSIMHIKKESENTLAALHMENDNIITQLTQQIEGYSTQNSQKDENLSILHQQLHDNEQQLTAANLQLQQYYQQIEILGTEVQKYSAMNDEFILKDNEINRLNALLNEKEREYQHVLSNKEQENSSLIQELTSENDSLKRRLGNLETHYDEVLSSKDMDLESYKIQLQDQMNRNNDLLKEQDEHRKVETELALQNAEFDDMKNRLNEQNHLLEEEEKQLGDLQKIIEDQVLKIQDLQRELYEKSRNYDALIAEVDITHQPAKELNSKTQSVVQSSDDLTEPVSRAELDLALYMLHQRDVRCEELTHELMQLLEERDTLQLKLSNALREREQLRSKFDQSDTLLSESSSMGTIPKLDSPSKEKIDVQETLEEENVNPLDTKLSELKMLSYRKDKTLLDEQELRRLQQLSIMQQHRDEASKLPAEAAARLVDASYTLCI